MMSYRAQIGSQDHLDRAVFLRLENMRNRSEFLRAARALRQGTQTMLVQARDRQDGHHAIRVGFTCSKKIGNAVTRNRAKRRLRHVAADILPGLGQQGWDYVLIGRPEKTVIFPYKALQRDFTYALTRLHNQA